MAKEGPNWDGLLKWSIANSDGTGNPRKLRYKSVYYLNWFSVVSFQEFMFMFGMIFN